MVSFVERNRNDKWDSPAGACEVDLSDVWDADTLHCEASAKHNYWQKPAPAHTDVKPQESEREHVYRQKKSSVKYEYVKY